MKESYFINVALETAIKSYLIGSKDKDGILYNSFEVVVIRILALIYGELDILNPYYLKDEVAFLNNLAKFGMSRADVALFKEDFLNYYNLEKQNKDLKIKKKNLYFRTVLKYLVDMFVQKKQSVGVNYQAEEMFLELIYTSHTKNPYRVSFNYLINDNPEYIEKYYYSKLNELEVTSDIGNTITSNLNLEALKYVGVNLSNLKDMSTEQIENAQREAYNYFEVDVASPMRDTDLEESINLLKNYNRQRLTSGNGYVDILLLMSVIVTSLSVIAIIFFSFM